MSPRTFLLVVVMIVIGVTAALIAMVISATGSPGTPAIDQRLPATQPSLTTPHDPSAAPLRAPADGGVGAEPALPVRFTSAPGTPAAAHLSVPSAAIPPADATGAAARSAAAPVTGTVPGVAAAAGHTVSRTVMSLDDGWRFTRSDQGQAADPFYPDADWAMVSVPHTWNAVDGENANPHGASYYRGVGWYRRHIAVPAEWAGRSVHVVFDGANAVAECFLNGKQVGGHRGGFAAFSCDISAVVRPGSDNLLAVRVSNAPADDIIPLYGDFTFCGGLYRSVRLVATDPLHISLSDFGSSGVYLTQPSSGTPDAEVGITAKVRNEGVTAEHPVVTAVVLDAEGRICAEASTKVAVLAHGGADAALRVRLPHPRRWNGRADPYLYRLRVSVGADMVEQPLGIRTCVIDPERGFQLNGNYLEPVPVRAG